jgi:hypothetical protein
VAKMAKTLGFSTERAKTTPSNNSFYFAASKNPEKSLFKAVNGYSEKSTPFSPNTPRRPHQNQPPQRRRYG